eukprot:TRINITY_DN15356_c0_g1_i1.p1 TRINITY_DN15356_c0_g1~~TRINITY_DN15356_c0_g1_i1.p1  ORF type:complete len:641 (+),score=53.85 TRINITY_DN15356_c0_g1_i1:175-2097(+)
MIKDTDIVVVPPTGEDCVICLVAMTGQDCVKTPCGHHFHHACLEKYLLTSRHAEQVGRRPRARCPVCRGSMRLPQAVEVSAKSGLPIEFRAVPDVGDYCHFDRSYTFESLGDFRRPGMFYVMTSNDDRKTPASAVMWVLDLHSNATVHLNFRGTRHILETGAIDWLRGAGWKQNWGLKSTVSTGFPNGPYAGPVYSKEFPPGRVELMGSNTWEGVYFVFVEVEKMLEVADPPAPMRSPGLLPALPRRPERHEADVELTPRSEHAVPLPPSPSRDTNASEAPRSVAALPVLVPSVADSSGAGSAANEPSAPSAPALVRGQRQRSARGVAAPRDIDFSVDPIPPPMPSDLSFDTNSSADQPRPSYTLRSLWQRCLPFRFVSAGRQGSRSRTASGRPDVADLATPDPTSNEVPFDGASRTEDRGGNDHSGATSSAADRMSSARPRRVSEAPLASASRSSGDASAGQRMPSRRRRLEGPRQDIDVDAVLGQRSVATDADRSQASGDDADANLEEMRAQPRGAGSRRRLSAPVMLSELARRSPGDPPATRSPGPAQIARAHRLQTAAALSPRPPVRLTSGDQSADSLGEERSDAQLSPNTTSTAPSSWSRAAAVPQVASRVGAAATTPGDRSQRSSLEAATEGYS